MAQFAISTTRFVAWVILSIGTFLSVVLVVVYIIGSTLPGSLTVYSYDPNSRLAGFLISLALALILFTISVFVWAILIIIAHVTDMLTDIRDALVE